MKRYSIIFFSFFLASCSGFLQYKKCAKEYTISLNKSQSLLEEAFLYQNFTFYRDYYNELSDNSNSVNDIDTSVILNELLVFYPNGRFIGPMYYNSDESLAALIRQNSEKIYSFSSLGRYKVQGDSLFTEHIQIVPEKAPIIKYQMKKMKFRIKNDSHEKTLHTVDEKKNIKYIPISIHDIKIDTNKFWNFDFESNISK